MNEDESDGSRSRLESELARAMKLALQGIDVGEDLEGPPLSQDGKLVFVEERGRLDDLLSTLDYFVPPVMQEVYPEWESEWIDGVISNQATRVGERELALEGECILGDDQRWVACSFLLLHHESRDSLESFVLSIGRPGPGRGGMQKGQLGQHQPQGAWVYRVSRGDLEGTL